MRQFFVLAAALTVANAVHADDKFGDLTYLLPPSANAATVIDVQAIYNSPLAQKENWAKQRPLPFPPTLYTVALATRIEPASLSGGHWEVGVGRPIGRVTMDQLAVREKGAVETIAGAQAVLSPRNVYFVELRPWIIGMVCPADRQEVAHWVKDIRNIPGGVVRLEPYLKAAVTTNTPATQFILAWDLSDSLDAAAVHKWFAGTTGGSRPQTAAAAAKVLATIQGLKLTITVTDAIVGELRFDFAEPASPLQPWAKPLLTQYLTGHGASVEAMEDWTAEAVDNAIVMKGHLREQGFRRILSLVAPPAPPAEQDGNTPLTAEIKQLATQRYYQTILTYLDDLRKPSKKTEQDYPKFATWYDSFEQKIEQLPTYAVDEDVARYGQATAMRLKAIAASLRGDVVDVQKLEKSISVWVSGIYANDYGWGRRYQPSVYLQTNEGAVRAQQQQAIERGTQTRQDLWSRIDNDTDAIGKVLAQRYPEKK
jgi:hypothetical protein